MPASSRAEHYQIVTAKFFREKNDAEDYNLRKRPSGADVDTCSRAASSPSLQFDYFNSRSAARSTSKTKITQQLPTWTFNVGRRAFASTGRLNFYGAFKIVSVAFACLGNL